ncbi:MAG: tetratricopeptide repeat protein [Chloroflexi bacterium]|nr:tetratricopeptide repeat protein [Chloroflexota bacterium]
MSQRAPDPLAASPPENPAETLAALIRLLDFAAPGRFVLAFVKCNLPMQRRALAAQVRAQVEPLGVSVLEVELTEPVEKLLPLLRERLAVREAPGGTSPARGKAALFVYGLEHSLPSGDPHPPLLAHLNMTRELFRRDLPGPLVLWLPDYALTLLARGAPDFWAWRSGVYEFPAEVETARGVAQEAVYAEAGHETSNLSTGAKRERLDTLARLLEDYRELGAGQYERSTQADILRKMGDVYYDLGEWAEAREHYEEALALARALEERRSEGGLLHQLGMLAQDTGDLAGATRLYGEAGRIFDELGAKQERAAVLHQLGRLAQATGDLAGATRLYEQSLGLERELGNKQGIAISLHQLGRLAQDTGDLAGATRLYEQSLGLERELGDKQGIAQTLHQLGLLAQDTGDLAGATRLYEQSLGLERELGDKQGIASTLHQLGTLAEEDGNLAEAARLFEESFRMLSELGSPDARIAGRSVERVKGKVSGG